MPSNGIENAAAQCDENAPSFMRTYSDAHMKIFEICNKPLENLPVSKDLPRLAKKFSLHVDNKEVSWIPTDDDIINSENSADMDEAMSLLVYHLLQNIHQSIQPQKDFTVANFPSYQKFQNEVNMNDHVTINQFLLKTFGEKDSVTQILKACHQSVIVHVLFAARAALMGRSIQFKDVRGAWKIILHFPANLNQSKPRNNNNENEDSIKKSHDLNDHLIDSIEQNNGKASSFDDNDADYITVCHKRREQVYMKTNDYLKHVEEYKRIYSESQSLNPLEALDGKKSGFIQLFQFEWQIKVVFKAMEGKNQLKVERVDIELLDILYKNEDNTVNNSPQFCEYQVAQVRNFFDAINANVPIALSISSFEEFTKQNMLKRGSTIFPMMQLNEANGSMSPSSFLQNTYKRDSAIFPVEQADENRASKSHTSFTTTSSTSRDLDTISDESSTLLTSSNNAENNLRKRRSSGTEKLLDDSKAKEHSIDRSRRSIWYLLCCPWSTR
jgi:hypothetical protein